MNWIPAAEEKKTRYERQFGELDERSLVRKGNAAYAAGLALLMAGDDEAGEWFRRASACWRASWSGGESWGRPIGALKASLLARDEEALEELVRRSLELGAATAESPIGRYAAALALLTSSRWHEARDVAESLRGRDDFPPDVADALASIAAHDAVGYIDAVESVVESFETRTEHLEDVAVADTALVLQDLARRRGIEHTLRDSPVLPLAASPSRPE
jgi:hypothetical protein